MVELPEIADPKSFDAPWQFFVQISSSSDSSCCEN